MNPDESTFTPKRGETTGPLQLTTQPQVSRLSNRVKVAAIIVVVLIGAAVFSALTKPAPERPVFTPRQAEKAVPFNFTKPAEAMETKPVTPVVTPPVVYQQSTPQQQPRSAPQQPKPPRQPTDAEIALAKAMKASPLAQPGQNGATAQQKDTPQTLEIAAQEQPSPYALDGTMYGISSPYTVMAGTVIPVTLIGGLNSELPVAGFALVAADVYDTATQSKLLIPQGAKVQFRYGDTVESENRLLVLADRFIFPPSVEFPLGSSVGLGNAPGTDLEGYGGVRDKVNRHLLQSFGKALIYAGVAAGTSIAQGGFGGSNAYHDPYSPADSATYALSREMERSATNSLRRGENNRPTFMIRPGYPFNITMDKDLSFKREWQPLTTVTQAPYRGAEEVAINDAR